MKAKDYLHYYLGCEVETNMRKAIGEGKPMKKLHGILKEVDLGMDDKVGILLEDEPDRCNYEYFKTSDIKPILRPLESMTEEEAKELDLADVQKGLLAFGTRLQMYMTADQFKKCLDMGFDLFNLIPSGEALEKID